MLKKLVIIIGLLMIIGSIWWFIASFFVACPMSGEGGLSPSFVICYLIPLLCIGVFISGIGLILFKDWARISSIIFFLGYIIFSLSAILLYFKVFLDRLGLIKTVLSTLSTIVIYGLPVYFLSRKKLKDLFL